MKTRRQTLGRWGEELAARHLAGKGYTILERNLRTPHGELDLVARAPIDSQQDPERGDVLVFVEVKTRASRTLGYPEISVTPRKQAHLIEAARYYLEEHPELEGDWRIDVIAIQRLHPGKPPAIHHFENAVT
jgi:putative endonuclease